MNPSPDKKPIWEAARELPSSMGSIFGQPINHEWRVVREYLPTNPDGKKATVEVSQWPAQFWRVRGGGIALTTGSGNEMGELAEQIAQAIAQGMLAPDRDVQ